MNKNDTTTSPAIADGIMNDYSSTDKNNNELNGDKSSVNSRNNDTPSETNNEGYETWSNTSDAGSHGSSSSIRGDDDKSDAHQTLTTTTTPVIQDYLFDKMENCETKNGSNRDNNDDEDDEGDDEDEEEDDRYLFVNDDSSSNNSCSESSSSSSSSSEDKNNNNKQDEKESTNHSISTSNDQIIKLGSFTSSTSSDNRNSHHQKSTSSGLHHHHHHHHHHYHHSTKKSHHQETEEDDDVIYCLRHHHSPNASNHDSTSRINGSTSNNNNRMVEVLESSNSYYPAPVVMTATCHTDQDADEEEDELDMDDLFQDQAVEEDDDKPDNDDDVDLFMDERSMGLEDFSYYFLDVIQEETSQDLQLEQSSCVSVMEEEAVTTADVLPKLCSTTLPNKEKDNNTNEETKKENAALFVETKVTATTTTTAVESPLYDSVKQWMTTYSPRSTVEVPVPEEEVETILQASSKTTTTTTKNENVIFDKDVTKQTLRDKQKKEGEAEVIVTPCTSVDCSRPLYESVARSMLMKQSSEPTTPPSPSPKLDSSESTAPLKSETMSNSFTTTFQNGTVVKKTNRPIIDTATTSIATEDEFGPSLYDQVARLLHLQPLPSSLSSTTTQEMAHSVPVQTPLSPPSLPAQPTINQEIAQAPLSSSTTAPISPLPTSTPILETPSLSFVSNFDSSPTDSLELPLYDKVALLMKLVVVDDHPTQKMSPSTNEPSDDAVSSLTGDTGTIEQEQDEKQQVTVTPNYCTSTPIQHPTTRTTITHKKSVTFCPTTTCSSEEENSKKNDKEYNDSAVVAAAAVARQIEINDKDDEHHDNHKNDDNEIRNDNINDNDKSDGTPISISFEITSTSERRRRQQRCTSIKTAHQRTSALGTTCRTRRLYESVRVMLENSLLAYVLAYARRRARETSGKIFSVLLELPLSKYTILQTFFEKEVSVFEEFDQSSPLKDTKYYLDFEQLYSMFEIHKQYFLSDKVRSDQHEEDDAKHEYIVEAGDLHQMEELVYFISVDHCQQEVCVIFRGSVTAKDWEADLQAAMCTYDQLDELMSPSLFNNNKDKKAVRKKHNEAKKQSNNNNNDKNVNDDDQRNIHVENLNADQIYYRRNYSKLQIHEGFAKYILSRPVVDVEHDHARKETIIQQRQPLLKLPTIQRKDSNQTHLLPTKTKCDIILEQVLDILQEFPLYSLSTTGHSLGGALSTIFASKACLMETIPKPVTCINFGSPKVGNMYFRRALSDAESKGLLRHLRVVNHYDPVPKVPTRALNSFCGLGCNGKSQMFDYLSTVYCHVGAKLHFHSKHPTKITYGRPANDLKEYWKLAGKNAKKNFSYFTWWFTEGKFGFEGLRAHSCLHYYQLMESSKEALEQTSMNDIYEKIQTRNVSLDEVGSSHPLVKLRVSLISDNDYNSSMIVKKNQRRHVGTTTLK